MDVRECKFWNDENQVDNSEREKSRIMHSFSVIQKVQDPHKEMETPVCTLFHCGYVEVYGRYSDQNEVSRMNHEELKDMIIFPVEPPDHQIISKLNSIISPVFKYLLHQHYKNIS